MRKAFSTQRRLDTHNIVDVPLNLECRDEIIRVLRALQHVYPQRPLRDEILRLIADDVNRHSRSDCGREGMDYWQIVVLAAVRLGCNLTYDGLQDLAENHRRWKRGVAQVETFPRIRRFDREAQQKRYGVAFGPKQCVRNRSTLQSRRVAAEAVGGDGKDIGVAEAGTSVGVPASAGADFRSVMATVRDTDSAVWNSFMRHNGT